MKRKAKPVASFPPELEAYDPAAWVDRYHWTLARWEHWQKHRDELPHVDPIQLIKARHDARRESL